ncbi:lamin tail domain-containing protein, partial [Candidatus Bipolaricaulota bacterium]|nr:lamin tail domain-containing protein [Candidatus Bipolaricaulota bacterium]
MVGKPERIWFFLLLFTIFPLLFSSQPLHSAEKGEVVINEIAWMGTDASSSDGWLELYNTTDKTFDLSSWSIYGADSGECPNFSAADGSKTMVIGSYGYIL